MLTRQKPGVVVLLKDGAYYALGLRVIDSEDNIVSPPETV